jgi:hypothetical protein
MGRLAQVSDGRLIRRPHPGNDWFPIEMNVSEKFGRWYVTALWTAAGVFCVLNVVVHPASTLTTPDLIFLGAGIGFFSGAIGVARHYVWARHVSLGLWALFGYWDFGALGSFGEMRWFPLVALVLFFAALLWLLSPAALGQPMSAVPRP